MPTTAARAPRGSTREWLARRDPAPPALARRLADVLGPAGLDAPHAADRFLAAAESLLDGMLHDGCATREAALDLLVCDALVTYAFEAGADEPERLDALTRQAMTRIAALASEGR